MKKVLFLLLAVSLECGWLFGDTVTGFSCPATVSSGATFTCTVSGSGEIDITTNNSLVNAPDDCTVGKTCSFTAKKVTKASSVVITASRGKAKFSQTVTVEPGTAPPPTLTILVPANATITGAGTDTLTADLSGPETVATSITVTSSQPTLLTVPASVPVGVGASSVQFTATAKAVSVQTPVTVLAGLNGNTASASITLDPVSTVAYSVNLSWQAPVTSPDPVAQYRVYRNGAPLAFTATLVYVDPTVVAGQTYNFTVTSVDAAGVESVPSNTYQAVIP
jgi:hypothetical protein